MPRLCHLPWSRKGSYNRSKSSQSTFDFWLLQSRTTTLLRLKDGFYSVHLLILDLSIVHHAHPKKRHRPWSHHEQSRAACRAQRKYQLAHLPVAISSQRIAIKSASHAPTRPLSEASVTMPWPRTGTSWGY